MADANTWMPFYIGDYLADTMHLNNHEHGAYVLLILHYWRCGPLPDDDKSLAAIARCDRKEWISEVGPVVRKFFRQEDGVLHHKRIDVELTKAMRNSSKRRDAANARWEQTRSKRDANASDVQCKPDDPRGREPSPSPSEEEASSSFPEPRARGNSRHPANGAGPVRWPDSRIKSGRECGETKPDNADRPLVNGTFLDRACEQVAEASMVEVVPLADKTLIQWLADGYEVEPIIEAIHEIADRPDFSPKPLAYFNAKVREKRPTYKPLQASH